MNDDDAANFFTSQGRRPSFTAGGKVRGFRSRPGAPQATPPRGLTTGSNAMSAVGWVKAFNNTGAGVQTAAVRELGRPLADEDLPLAARQGGFGAAPAQTAAAQEQGEDYVADMSRTGAGGIVEQTLAPMFGAGHWNKLMGRGWSTPPPMEGVVGTQSMTRRITGLPTGQFASASFVPGQNSPANLAKRKNPLSWSNPWAGNG